MKIKKPIIQPATPDAVGSTRPLREAFEATRAERDALAVEELLEVNVALDRAATLAQGAYPAIEALLPELAAAMPELDVALVRSIPTKADAAHHAQSVYAAASSPDPELPQLNAEAEALRELLYADLARAATHGTIGADRLREVSRLRGYRVVAADLGVLATVARSDASALTGKTMFTGAEVDRAEQLVARLWHAIALQEDQPSRVAVATEERARAFTLLHRAYDAARRAVGYARWKAGDANRIAPSLWTPVRHAQAKVVEEAASEVAAAAG